jgi:DNA replication protein DnaC
MVDTTNATAKTATNFFILLFVVYFNIDTNSADSKIKRHELMNAEEILLNSSNILLKLSDNNKWPFLGSNTLFIRDFYSSFYDQYIGNYKEGTKIVISGTPGIGKSAFGCYAIYRALKDGKIVVFQTAKKPASW